MQTWTNTSENVDLRLLQKGLIGSDLGAVLWFLKAKVLQFMKPRVCIGTSAILCIHR